MIMPLTGSPAARALSRCFAKSSFMRRSCPAYDRSFSAASRARSLISFAASVVRERIVT
ncbi:Uncharacterised protein [Mycobacterium tuberculosis]|nr:Uncharacterised protein [Mycobacterium tuberculosis]